jgi:hypothetical protein
VLVVRGCEGLLHVQQNNISHEALDSWSADCLQVERLGEWVDSFRDFIIQK